MVILKLGKLYIVIPFTMAKIEVRVRNVMINQRHKMEGISTFVELYLQQQEIVRISNESKSKKKAV